MQGQFIHDGAAIDYTPALAVAAGDVVVQEQLIGVAKMIIAANALGALAVVGVFDFTKTAGTGEAIDAGEKVYWDDASNVVTTTASGLVYLGKCVADADDDAVLCRVRLDQ